MQRSEYEDFSAVVNTVASAYRIEINEEGIKFFFDLLIDFSLDAVRRAFRRWATSGKKFFPKPPEIYAETKLLAAPHQETSTASLPTIEIAQLEAKYARILHQTAAAKDEQQYPLYIELRGVGAQIGMLHLPKAEPPPLSTGRPQAEGRKGQMRNIAGWIG